MNLTKSVTKFMMCRPTFFQVKYEINPWMRPGDPVNLEKALQQWNNLKNIIEKSGGEVLVMEPEASLQHRKFYEVVKDLNLIVKNLSLQGANNYPDLVFAANAAVVRGNKAYLSNFFYPERKGEDYYYDKWFKENGYITKKDIHVPFEGAGDALWVGKNKLFCGIGPRTDVRALNLIAKNLKDEESPFKVYGFRLIDPRFYHIDTCLCAITEQLAIYYPYAFDPVARHNMSNELELVPVTEEEAIRFACNSIVIGKSVIIPVGAEQTAKALQKLGFDPKFVDMSEFIKSGGAAKCCTLQLSQ